jgi:hypothetical protein
MLPLNLQSIMVRKRVELVSSSAAENLRLMANSITIHIGPAAARGPLPTTIVAAIARRDVTTDPPRGTLADAVPVVHQVYSGSAANQE